MSFYNLVEKLNQTDLKTTHADILQIIEKSNLNERDFLALLSPEAQNYLEEMAQKAHRLTLQNFGKVVHLYTPVYLSDYCQNKCLYCGFNIDNKTKRKKLTLSELEKEAKIIASTGLKNIIILTGEDRIKTPVDYILKCIELLRKYFTSVTVEIYPLTEKEYNLLIKEGIYGLTIYQETYDLKLYKKLHSGGPKSDFKLRLDAPERAGKAGIRQINIGALLGLGNLRKDIFIAALHAKYLQNKYPSSEISVSIPRLRPYEGRYKNFIKISRKDIVQAVTAIRIFMPQAGINLSTREDAIFRENLLPLGITKMSAGVSTSVGGRIEKTKSGQFEISDTRSVSQIKKMILKKGYQPVLQDWI